MNYFKNNVGFFVLFFVNILFFFLDFYFTFKNSLLLDFIELNPLFHIFKSLIIIIVINVFFFVGVLFLYLKTTTHINRFLIILLFVTLILLRIIAIQNALSWSEVELTPETLSQIEKEYTPEVRSSALKGIVLGIAFPYLFTLIVFFFYNLDHKIIRKK